jgi:hypothetical protein
MSLPLYETILFNDLQIPQEFLQAHEKTLSDRLRQAAVDLQRQDGNIHAINQCINVASSVVLRNPTNIASVLDSIRRLPQFEYQDATTVVTIATLYYLLHTEAKRQMGDVQRQGIDRICRRLNEVSWLIGREGMAVLGFDSAEK